MSRSATYLPRAAALPLCAPRFQAVAAALLLVLLLLPASRHALENSMWRHMLLQFPLLLLAGAGLAGVLSARVRAGLARWNAHGISGLVTVALVLALLMVPRVLDLALVSLPIEAAKCAALVLASRLVACRPSAAYTGAMVVASRSAR